MGLGVRRSLERMRMGLLERFSAKHQLNHRGKGTINLVDVGSLGPLPEPWLSNQDQIAFLLNFEPNEPTRRSANTLTLDTALWECEEERPFHIYKGFESSGSSLFEQNIEYVRANFEMLSQRGERRLALTWFERSALLRSTTLRCRSLDDVLRTDCPDRAFHFLKIDAQGAELPILRGARALLESTCVGLHLELFTLPLYKGIALMPEVVAYLQAGGFELVKQFPAHGSFHSQHDCLFIHRTRDPDRAAAVRRVYGLRQPHETVSPK